MPLTKGGNLFSEGESLFNDEVVHKSHLTFDDENYCATLTSNYDNNYPDVPYIMANATIDGMTVDSIRVRIKGFYVLTYSLEEEAR
ncbi:MAG: spore coat protein CotH [Polaribacter sp.]